MNVQRAMLTLTDSQVSALNRLMVAGEVIEEPEGVLRMFSSRDEDDDGERDRGPERRLPLDPRDLRRAALEGLDSADRVAGRFRAGGDQLRARLLVWCVAAVAYALLDIAAAVRASARGRRR